MIDWAQELLDTGIDVPEDYDEFILVTILRHERNDLYAVRLSSGKNIISVSSKFIEIKEVK